MTKSEKMRTSFSFWGSVLAFSAFKLLFINSYRSTDFEVHRNWLAITNSLPLEKWYYENTSEWTLDYPPFFAYFEWLLSHPAQWIEPEMVQIRNTSYESPTTVLFQKSTVVLSDLLLAISITRYSKIVTGTRHQISLSLNLFILVFMNAGLFIVDHIHFQYNGFLFGLLLLSIGNIFQGKYYSGALFFAVLLNFKHIFLYMAPAYGMFLFSKCCLKKSSFQINIGALARLSAIVIGVCSISFGPFIQHIPQILERLFPFKRGLSHAYWSPNVWALYNSVDLAASLVTGNKSGVTGGLVGERPMAVLPQVEPKHTFVLTLLFMIPLLYQIWRRPTLRSFIHGVILTAWTSFMFGYHVHEKAILNVIIPFSLVAILEPSLFVITLLSGTVSLFPLLFTPFENIVKILLTLTHLCLVLLYVVPVPKFKWYEYVYLLGFIPLNFVELFCSIYFPGYPFLPLICISDYCFLGLFYSYVIFYFRRR